MLHSYERRPATLLVTLVLFAMLVPTDLAMGGTASLTLTARYQAAEPVVLDMWSSVSHVTLDPALAADEISFTPVENLFHGLTDKDPVSMQIVPELATSWITSEDGLIWTFTLRNDIVRYRYDPARKTAETLGVVVASDVVYGINRACDPCLGGYY